MTLWLTLLLAVNPLAPLISLGSIDTRIRQDMRYASMDNFTHQRVYRFHRCYLLPQTAQALHRAQRQLEAEGFGLKVWDCFRPLSAQQTFWKLVPDPRYVSPPSKGGLHTRGTAVDLTLVDSLGRELEMPTGFDDFSPAAARHAPGTSPKAAANARRLEAAMVKQGFIGLDSEWWHFDLRGWQQHPPLKVEIAPEAEAGS